MAELDVAFKTDVPTLIPMALNAGLSGQLQVAASSTQLFISGVVQKVDGGAFPDGVTDICPYLATPYRPSTTAYYPAMSESRTLASVYVSSAGRISVRSPDGATAIAFSVTLPLAT